MGMLHTPRGGAEHRRGGPQNLREFLPFWIANSIFPTGGGLGEPQEGKHGNIQKERSYDNAVIGRQDEGEVPVEG
jgi:hypothetical protein